MRIERSCTIAAPRDEVWEVIDDPANWYKLLHGLTRFDYAGSGNGDEDERIHEAMLAQSDKLGNFAHGFTYAGHPVAAAVALEVQKIYAEIDIVGRAKRLGPVLQSALGRLKGHPLVGDVCGVGLILGMELMRDGERRIPFDAALNVGGTQNALDDVANELESAGVT